MRRLAAILLLATAAMTVRAQGYPVIRNFTHYDYKAHNVNFDLETDSAGIVYVANFEGLMYYDNVEWRIIHTPGITRVTVVKRDQHGTIWVGGYNYFGRVARKENGELSLQRVGSPDAFRGEIQEIFEQDGTLQFIVNDDHIYQVKDDRISVKAKLRNTRSIGLTEVINVDDLSEGQDMSQHSPYNQEIDLKYGMTAAVTRGEGIIIKDEIGRELYHLTKEHGLYNNNVIWITYDGHGTIWGICDDAVFSIAVPSVFSRYTAQEGLPGSVQAIENYRGSIYAGTTEGLFKLEKMQFVQVDNIRHACWKLLTTERGLLAATSNGIYLIGMDGKASQLTQSSTYALFADSTCYYSGEFDGVYQLSLAGGHRTKLLNAEKVNKILKDRQGTLWMQNLYGEVWRKRHWESKFTKVSKEGAAADAILTIVPLADRVETVSDESETPFPYPLFSYLDDNGVTWMTNSDGKHLYRWKDGRHLNDMHRLIRPLRDAAIHSIHFEEATIWLGSDNGLWIIANQNYDPLLSTEPQLLLRSVTLAGDSILWGGFGNMPQQLPQLDSQDRNLRFTYAVDYPLHVGETHYRYKLNNGKWSTWDTDNDVEFSRLPYGTYTLTIEALLATGEVTAPVTIQFSIAYPIYLRWWMMILYALLTGMLIYLLFRYRLRRLERDKIRLESVIQERTAEVVKQKDEIEMKSKSLETALNELHKAQNELIRQEKMATVGKLTQGLIDRILNPMNYINNFSKLSEGLVKDIEANIEDDKDQMAPDNYEDTREVLDMLRTNLQKVGEHGQSTTRTLKAMEEMLKDRSGGIVRMDLAKLLHQDEQMLNTYYAKDIANHHIKVNFQLPEGELPINGNAEQLSKALMSLLGNGIYAIIKKLNKNEGQIHDYHPEISVILSRDKDHYLLAIRDNGTGISENIIGKIFDPFFTTKTTAEASGIGLYLSREIMQNHGGDIHVESVKNEYSEFTITLPALIS